MVCAVGLLRNTVHSARITVRTRPKGTHAQGRIRPTFANVFLTLIINRRLLRHKSFEKMKTKFNYLWVLLAALTMGMVFTSCDKKNEPDANVLTIENGTGSSLSRFTVLFVVINGENEELVEKKEFGDFASGSNITYNIPLGATHYRVGVSLTENSTRDVFEGSIPYAISNTNLRITSEGKSTWKQSWTFTY